MSEFLRNNRKTVTLALIIGGIVLILAALLADVTGVGAFRNIFGWKQIAALVVGAIALGGGIMMWRAPKA